MITKMKVILCHTCNKPMRFLGNIDKIVYASYPPQWDDTYVCDNCKTKEKVREYGLQSVNYDFLKEYIDQNKKIT